MKLSRVIGSFVFVTTVLQGCNSSDSLSVDKSPGLDSSTRPSQSRPASSTQIDVFNDVVAAAKENPQVPPQGVSNLFSNPNFEIGVDGWSNCTADPLSLSTDAYQGTHALEIMPDNCVYRSVQVEPGGTYLLSCEVKLEATKAWTGMGLVFANANYDSLFDGPVAQATSGEYTTLISKGTAPTGTSFVTMWIHSDHGALVDDCSLVVESEPSDTAHVNGNVLSNSDFTSLDSNGDAHDWVTGCGGVAVADGTSLYLADATCVDQSLNVDAISSTRDSDTTFACLVSEVDGYADLSVYLDGKLAGVRQITPNDINTTVKLDVSAGNISNGFVTLYSENHLKVDECTLVTHDAESTDPTDPGDGSTPVIFASERLESIVKVNLGLALENRPLTRNDMLALTSLTRFVRGPVDVDSLVGLEYATNLEQLRVHPPASGLVDVSPLEPLAGLINLRSLAINTFSGKPINTVSDLTHLATMTGLTSLNLALSDDATNLEPLSNLNLLRELTLYISDDYDLSTNSMAALTLNILRNRGVSISLLPHSNLQ